MTSHHAKAVAYRPKSKFLHGQKNTIPNKDQLAGKVGICRTVVGGALRVPPGGGGWDQGNRQEEQPTQTWKKQGAARPSGPSFLSELFLFPCSLGIALRREGAPKSLWPFFGYSDLRIIQVGIERIAIFLFLVSPIKAHACSPPFSATTREGGREKGRSHVHVKRTTPR